MSEKQDDEADTGQTDEQPEGTDEETGQESEEDAPPEGTVDEVMEWVGDDPDKAQQALDAENESDAPRSTLVGPVGGPGREVNDGPRPYLGGIGGRLNPDGGKRDWPPPGSSVSRRG